MADQPHTASQIVEAVFGAQATGSITPAAHGLNVLLTEADRGCVLTAASFIQDLLSKGISKKFYELTKVENADFADLFDSGNLSAPLSTLSAQIKIAAAVGLIDGEQHRLLHAIRKLRNKAAHSWTEFAITKQDLDHFSSIYGNELFQRIRHIAVSNQELVISQRVSDCRLTFVAFCVKLIAELHTTIGSVAPEVSP